MQNEEPSSHQLTPQSSDYPIPLSSHQPTPVESSTSTTKQTCHQNIQSYKPTPSLIYFSIKLKCTWCCLEFHDPNLHDKSFY